MSQEQTVAENVQAQTREANIYTVAGKGIHVSYLAAGIGGEPSLAYQDAHVTRTFKGQEIRIMGTESDQLVSVSIQTTIDSGYTSFTLVVPRVNLLAGQSAHVATLGITGTHRFTVTAPALGQLDAYQVTHLSGTAAQADF